MLRINPFVYGVPLQDHIPLVPSSSFHKFHN